MDDDVMLARVKKTLVHMIDGDHVVAEGTQIEVKHLAYDTFYTIVGPIELRGITVSKSDIEFIPQHGEN